MKHGFKARAEATSEALRGELGIPLDEALPARELAGHLRVKVLTVEEIPGLSRDHVSVLTNCDGAGWSAFTLEAASRRYVVHNHTHSSPRQESDIMHELAHVLCAHEPGEVLWIGSFCLRHYDPEEEEEAAWLGATLQIPRKGLLWLARRGLSVPELADRFRASESMVSFRLHKGGVRAQVARERRRR